MKFDKDVSIYFNMAKFRNRIVHMYFNISDEMIYDIVQNNISDFEKFISNVVSVISRK
ncbi:HepT-like ribonuclease domain-containing protein [Clostridium sp. DL-VIII]|uniref:HepT-like ribonuclease domain-containing protein n=1 Tax=Clostridium sp. DL-VIII TaxID=641107 RepID=UPI0002EA96AE|nr:HepT-like ribonuclease domain-containing protein [Clostridium sp. DL-VIII]